MAPLRSSFRGITEVAVAMMACTAVVALLGRAHLHTSSWATMSGTGIVKVTGSVAQPTTPFYLPRQASVDHVPVGPIEATPGHDLHSSGKAFGFAAAATLCLGAAVSLAHQLLAQKTEALPMIAGRRGSAQNHFSIAAVVSKMFGSTTGTRRTEYYSTSMAMCSAAGAGLSQDELKKLVGYKAVDDHVRSGMVVGLGTGSTAYFAVERVGQRIKSGELKDIVCIPTSVRTREQAEQLGIPLCTLNEKSHLDVSIDGADEVDPDWNLVKGGGGALLREKMVEIVSDKFICIVDESKLCKGLGPGFPLPVEITPFCHEHTLRVVSQLPAIAPYLKEAVLRMGSSSTFKRDGDNIAITDNGNYIVDLYFKEVLKDAPAAAAQLKNTVGVVEHGLFIGMATEVIVAGKDGVYVLPKRQ